MVRISGVDLPRNKRIEIGLTYIFGIGLTSSKQILASTNISPDTICMNLTDEEINVSVSYTHLTLPTILRV